MHQIARGLSLDAQDPALPTVRKAAGSASLSDRASGTNQDTRARPARHPAPPVRQAMRISVVTAVLEACTANHAT